MAAGEFFADVLRGIRFTRITQIIRKANEFPPSLDFARFQRQTDFMADELFQRLEKLESHAAHLEHQVEQLNEVVIEQGKLLERLKRETQRQSSAMESLELERIKANNPKPPHH
jgi:SlyX protein